DGRARPYHDAITNRDALPDGATGPKPGSFPDRHIARQRGAGRDMTGLADTTVVVNARAGVDDGRSADLRTHANDRSGGNEYAVAQPCRPAENGRRVNDARGFKAVLAQCFEEAQPGLVVADRDNR